MNFDDIYQTFTQSSYWQDMLSVKENSKWHHESNIAEHTRMTLAWYNNNLASSRSDELNLMTRLALLFHDVGKPSSKVLKEETETGPRYSFPGHELKSARIFEDFMLSNNLISDYFFLRKIRWLIEHHLPFNFTSAKNQAILKHDLESLGPEVNQAFVDMVLSDAHGRISTDHETKLKGVNDWLNNFSNLNVSNIRYRETEEKYMFVLIGPSGSGKSTLSNTIFNSNEYEIVSLDTYRLEFYKLSNENLSTNEIDLYALAFNYCVNNSAFEKYWKAKFINTIKSGKNIVLDNTNTSSKSRRYWITLAKQHNYKITAIEFMSSLSTLVERQNIRPDKNVPSSAVERQYYSLASASLGEVDNIFIYVNNSELIPVVVSKITLDFNSVKFEKTLV